MTHLRLNKVLWLIVTTLSLLVAIAGAMNPSIYTGLIDPNIVPGQVAQDWLTIGVALLLYYLIWKVKANETKIQLTIIGITGSLCYLYAIFAIEQIYNWLYLIYLAIFSIAFFSTCYAIYSLQDTLTKSWQMSNKLRVAGIVFSIGIAVLFSILWVSALLPLMTARDRVEHLFSIYILDLCFVMPGFVITAYLSFKTQSFGLLLSPAMYILGIFVIFPLGIGELAKPYFGQSTDTKSMLMSFVLSGLFVLFAVLQLRSLKLFKTLK